MLPISVAKVAEVIILARELDRAEPEFDGLVNALNAEEQAALVAIYWIGRGTYDADDLDEAMATATNEATTPTTEYLKGSPLLATHLEAGLDALGIDATEEEDRLIKPV
ncbi:DUF3775 domain-containing protein [Yoonia sp.]|uniref:DUF3775 domain-containing protein n=1 Tax=Yoonia sp. TaxID=2212373 RepID=UPI003F6D849F